MSASLSTPTDLDSVARSGWLLRRMAVRIPTYWADVKENPSWLPMFVLARTMVGCRLH